MKNISSTSFRGWRRGVKRLRGMRKAERLPVGAILLYAAAMLVLGILIGFAAKWLDLNSDFLGSLFSRIMVWFVICTAIAVHSKSPSYAALNVFLFCIGMLGAYYLAAIWWEAVWGAAFMYGWTAFSLSSPLFAFFVWYATGKGGFALLLKIGVLEVSLAAEAVLFGLRAYDLVLAGILAYILFSKLPGARNDR